MDSAALLRTAFSDLHHEFVDDVRTLTHEEFFWQPTRSVNHVGFVVRHEDTVVSQSTPRQAELWASEGWAATFAMDASKQGAGMPVDEVGSQRYQPGDLLDYARAVWSRTDAALAQLAPARLAEPLAWSSEWKLANLLTTGCLSHGWMHLGEIRQLRGLRGWPFRK